MKRYRFSALLALLVFATPCAAEDLTLQTRLYQCRAEAPPVSYLAPRGCVFEADGGTCRVQSAEDGVDYLYSARFSVSLIPFPVASLLPEPQSQIALRYGNLRCSVGLSVPVQMAENCDFNNRVSGECEGCLLTGQRPCFRLDWKLIKQAQGS